MTSDTRERITTSASTLFRRQGYTGTGLTQIAAESRANVGSIYHFFDGGKEALAEEVVQRGGAAYGAMVLALLNTGAPDPVDSLGRAFEQAAGDLQSTDYADACPIATIALETANTHDRIRAATAGVFEDWIEQLTIFCGRITSDPTAARDLATTFLTMLEGAFVLARSMRDPEPLITAGRSIVQLATAIRSCPVQQKPATA